MEKKYKNCLALSAEALLQSIREEKENLRKLEFAHAISPIENPMKLRHTRRWIARLKTAYNHKIAIK